MPSNMTSSGRRRTPPDFGVPCSAIARVVRDMYTAMLVCGAYTMRFEHGLAIQECSDMPVAPFDGVLVYRFHQPDRGLGSCHR